MALLPQGPELVMRVPLLTSQSKPKDFISPFHFHSFTCIKQRIRVSLGNPGLTQECVLGRLDKKLSAEHTSACSLQTIRVREISHVLYSAQACSLTNTLI